MKLRRQNGCRSERWVAPTVESDREVPQTGCLTEESQIFAVQFSDPSQDLWRYFRAALSVLADVDREGLVHTVPMKRPGDAA